MATPHKSPFLSSYCARKEGHYKRRGQIFHSFQRGIFALILRGEIDGALTPSPLIFTHTPPYLLLITPLLPCTPLSLHVHVHLSAHHIYTFSTLHFTIPYTIVFLFLFANFINACAMLHIPSLFVPLGFLPIAENPHDNVSSPSILF